VAEVASVVRDRRRAFGFVIALAASAALAWAPMALGAGDPIASGTFKLKRAGSFKKQLKRNHVKMRPKAFKIRTGSSLDPTTGAGTIRLGKIKFKKGGKKVVYSNVKARLGANGGKGSIRGSDGKIFKLRGGTLTRVGFGAALAGVKIKFFRGAARKINRKLELARCTKAVPARSRLTSNRRRWWCWAGLRSWTPRSRPCPVEQTRKRV
jgi:hypothetical protein